MCTMIVKVELDAFPAKTLKNAKKQKSIINQTAKICFSVLKEKELTAQWKTHFFKVIFLTNTTKLEK